MTERINPELQKLHELGVTDVTGTPYNKTRFSQNC